jgi:hypothetical protein
MQLVESLPMHSTWLAAMWVNDAGLPTETFAKFPCTAQRPIILSLALAVVMQIRALPTMKATPTIKHRNAL